MGLRDEDNGGADPLRTYLVDIGRHDLLTRLDEERLGQSIESGRKASKELEEGDGGLPAERRRHLRGLIAECEQSSRQFVVANLRLVVSIAKRYRNSGVPLSDLIQEGNIGLMQAARKFDYRRGFRFSTYATFWIRQAIGRAVANSGRTIRLPIEVGDRVRALHKAKARLESDLRRPPTTAELGADLDLPPQKVVDLLEVGASTVSLSSALGYDEGELGDRVQDERASEPFEGILTGMQQTAVDRLLAVLGDRERELLCLRFGLSGDDPMSRAAVGKRLGVTAERVRQIEAKAITRLRPELASLAEQGLIDS